MSLTPNPSPSERGLLAYCRQFFFLAHPMEIPFHLLTNSVQPIGVRSARASLLQLENIGKQGGCTMVAVPSKQNFWDEIYDFLSSTPTPEDIIAYRPSEAMQVRVRYLLDKNRQGTLTAEENAEIDEIARIDHFMTMLKAHAREKLMEE
jgi:hypothetical protein